MAGGGGCFAVKYAKVCFCLAGQAGFGIKNFGKMEPNNMIIKVSGSIYGQLESKILLEAFGLVITGFYAENTKTGLPVNTKLMVFYAKYRQIAIRKKIMAYIFRFAAQ